MALTDLIAHSARIFLERELLNSMCFAFSILCICLRKLLGRAVFNCDMKHKGGFLGLNMSQNSGAHFACTSMGECAAK